MCLAKAYLGEGREQQLVMEDIASLKIEGKAILLRNLFGDRKEIEGTVREVDFQNARVIVEVSQGGKGK